MWWVGGEIPLLIHCLLDLGVLCGRVLDDFEGKKYQVEGRGRKEEDRREGVYMF